MFTVGSLFSGIGGMDLGLERSGMQIAWIVEIDVKCNEVLSHHWPDVRRYGDVRDVGYNLEPVDVIVGGFPCQDVSIAGKREGLAGSRSRLWFEFHRILEELRPKWVVIENVPGLLSSNGGRDFAIVLQGLAGIGYLSAWRVLDAQYYGLAQRRKRVFVVSSFGDGSCSQILFEPESLSWDSAPSRSEGKDVTASLKASPPSRRAGGSWPIAEEFVIANTLAYNWQSGGDVRLSFGLPNLQANQVPAVGVRRLTPTECERLQGFPDDFTAVNGISDSARYRMLGNAVAVPVAQWLGARILEAAANEI